MHDLMPKDQLSLDLKLISLQPVSPFQNTIVVHCYFMNIRSSKYKLPVCKNAF